jgi:hypothetical protein
MSVKAPALVRKAARQFSCPYYTKFSPRGPDWSATPVNTGFLFREWLAKMFGYRPWRSIWREWHGPYTAPGSIRICIGRKRTPRLSMLHMHAIASNAGWFARRSRNNAVSSECFVSTARSGRGAWRERSSLTPSLDRFGACLAFDDRRIPSASDFVYFVILHCMHRAI